MEKLRGSVKLILRSPRKLTNGMTLGSEVVGSEVSGGCPDVWRHCRFPSRNFRDYCLSARHFCRGPLWCSSLLLSSSVVGGRIELWDCGRLMLKG